MQEEKRTWGQIRVDKERRPKEAKGDRVPPADGILDVRICFRASTAIRDLSRPDWAGDFTMKRTRHTAEQIIRKLKTAEQLIA